MIIDLQKIIKEMTDKEIVTLSAMLTCASCSMIQTSKDEADIDARKMFVEHFKFLKDIKHSALDDSIPDYYPSSR
ncbi:MAG: hypothetical protein IJU76_04555 [Desulfovibrionaceae bacterium]|nr:hypothetical protein [Desulfovibrionaceae bacterium]